MGRIALSNVWLVVVATALSLFSQRAIAQLAITEVMSFAATSFQGVPAPGLADFWELTNFGTNAIDLTGYTWNDNGGGLSSDDDLLFRGIEIAAKETILLVQSEPNNPIDDRQFRDWWGSMLPEGVRIFFYAQNGFNQSGDGIRLWAPGETNAANVVDQVDFGIARRGRTFTYDSQTGLFGWHSVEGADGAFAAATRDDVGSPGTTTGPVPLQILQEPENLAVCAGIDATFSVEAGGLPRPRYRWFFNGAVIAAATASTFTIPSPQAANAGRYEVEISNGFQTLLSRSATLSVNTNPTPPVFVSPLTDAIVVSNDVVRFSAMVCAQPPPTFQWLNNGVPIAGATNRTLVLPNVQFDLSGSVFCVRVANALGTNSACATLTVTPKPDLAVTEVMPSASTNCILSTDWFELTNFGSNAVNLLGYRWATGNGRMPALEATRVVTNSVILLPGQSAIFVERLTRGQFLNRWGAERLPPELIVITYSGEGLDQFGDELYFWSPGATDPNDPVTSRAWAGSLNGVSKFYFEKTLDALDYDSVPGEQGAFLAEQCDDIGSPGYITNPPPRIVRLSRDAGGSTLRCRAIPGRSYSVKWKRRLTDLAWTTLTTRSVGDWVETITDTTAGGAEQRFYLLEETP